MAVVTSNGGGSGGDDDVHAIAFLRMCRDLAARYPTAQCIQFKPPIAPIMRMVMIATWDHDGFRVDHIVAVT